MNAQLQSQVVTVQVERPGVEMLDPRPNPQWLSAISQSTGGRYITPDEIESWAKGMPSTPMVSQTVQKTGLWHHPSLAGLFLGLLCMEWLLRRRNRLA